uniref:J domain-containing protein n=1 Tax=Globodera rostochiensis TaxID=31243 RepID=A0A914H249_GLORO
MDFDPFEALQLKPCGDKEQIKKAYYRLALKLHPDKLEPDKPKDWGPFRRIKKAYDFLWEMGAKALAEFVLNFAAQKEHWELTRHLIIAAQNGRMNEARRLLKRGADPRETGTVTVDGQMINKVTAFRVAAFKGHLEMCKLLVSHGKANDVDQQDNKWMVCAACYGGHLDIVKHFFGTGIDNCWRLALAAASFHGRDEVLRHLLSEEKASAERSSNKGKSSSSASSKSRRETAADGMPQNTKQQIRAEKVFQFSGFVDAKRWRSNIKADILNRLLNVDAPQLNCPNPLIVAALNGHLKAVEILLENKAKYLREMFEMTIDGNATMTSLWVATAAGHSTVIRRLLKMKGTDPNKGAKLTIDGKAITDLSPLCIVTSKRICELLIKNGANVDQQMGNGQTPLFCACIRGNFEIVKCLVVNGADINAVDKLGRTPLMAAAFHGHAGLVRYLLEKGARIDLATNAGGSTARDFADQSGNGEVAKMLREAGRQRTTA